MNTLKALLKRVIDGGLRRLGLVRVAAASAQTVDAIYLSTLGRAPDANERAENAGALHRGVLSSPALIETLSASAEGKARLWDTALPVFASEGYVAPQAHVEQLVEIAFLVALGRGPDSEALSAYQGALRSGQLSIDAFISEVSTCREAQLKALDLLKSGLTEHRYFSAEEHYRVVADAIFQSVLGRPLDDPDGVFTGSLIAGELTLETAIEQLMDSEEVRMRLRHVGLPDVLEGIYRALQGAPESDPDLRSLIRGAASQRTFELIKTMSISAEAHHYLMQPIIRAHRQQFLAGALD